VAKSRHSQITGTAWRAARATSRIAPAGKERVDADHQRTSELPSEWRRPSQAASSASVWRAIMSSSSVRTTWRLMRLSRPAIDVSPAALACGSSTAPSHASFSTMRARMPGEFSPIPAVNTKASRPPSAAASRPAWSPTRSAK
jgi:hypothetical protein